MRLPYLLLAVLLGGPASAFAHKLNVDPTLTADRLKVEAYYDDDTPAQDARVTVRSGEEIVAEGRTDDRGVWSCPKPPPGTYTIRVDDVAHVGRETIEVPDPNAGTASTVDPADRSEKTGVPWFKLLLGLAVITGLTLLWRAWPRPRSLSANGDPTA